MTPALAPAWLTARPIAHRGLHDRAAGLPENSLAAAEAAIALGYAIECDVQLSRDGEAMVFHDEALGRLCGAPGLVRERDAADLAGLSLLGGPERVPTLPAFLSRIAGRTPLVVEVKSRFDGDLALARRTAEVVAAYAGPVALKSFDPAVVAALADLAPGLPRGIVAESRRENDAEEGAYAGMSPEARASLAHLLHFAESRPDFLSWRVDDLPNAATHLARLLGGRPVMTWTVRTPAQVARARLHADQMVFEGFRA
ncbi:glycerophosphoryl diester phosphodiesterase [Methylobacterium sp. 4-46]|uniref:glycerophosphodiester phosphodiesterase family protein n=1 Tax=unclassified Methylobacterium TaxID=2615210 RepID=UPI000152C92C|nr:MULTISPECIES: glycerophosphodiester phosphodiesterase family protein [Methylobacterium]ACA20795.1 glycerophosphoryl diester phosphodiesterase [Methylobacterium sp. 4-46]WFT79949.1 glycerophosphodiester phosphodiesterase family protein [Methylobacterium nodulans]